MKKFLCVLLIIFVVALLAACSSGDDADDPDMDADIPEPTSTPTPIPASPTPTPYPYVDYSVTRPYEVGQIMIIMYHGLTEGESTSYQRNPDDFRQDLQDLYDMGFRTISMTDYINNNIITLPGFTPVVITFDDGLPSTFSLVDEGGTLVPAPGTAIAIMEEFYSENPDFGKDATLYIHGKETDFPGDGTLAERLNWLVDNGYELGNHTWDHNNLSEITSSETLQRQIALTDKAIKDAVPGYQPVGISYPFGIRPNENLRSYIPSGEYDGHRYSYNFALLVGDRTTDFSLGTAPNRNGFDPWRISRVRGSNDEITDLGWRLFVHYEQYPMNRYISDGNPDRIAVPEIYRHNVDTESLAGKELYVYE